MPITGVFFIPSNPNAPTSLATITERLHSASAEEPIHIGRWALEHKLMRDTPSCLPPSASQRPTTPKYMQFLSLSSYPNHGFIYTSQPSETGRHQPTAPGVGVGVTQGTGVGTGAAASTPSGSQASAAAITSPMVMTTVPLSSVSSLYQHFVYACQPFWCHRHTVTVLGGMVYDVGDFRVRVGDVRQTQPAARARGTVVEIEYRGPSLVTTITSLYQAKKDGRRRDNNNNSMRFPDADEDGYAGDGDDSGIDMAFPDGVEDADVDAEYAATAALIREFWARLGVEGAREAILVPDVGREVKGQLRELKKNPHGKQRRSDEASQGDGGGQQVDEDPDPDAGVDVARQFMEIFRFNR